MTTTQSKLGTISFQETNLEDTIPIETIEKCLRMQKIYWISRMVLQQLTQMAAGFEQSKISAQVTR